MIKKSLGIVIIAASLSACASHKQLDLETAEKISAFKLRKDLFPDGVYEAFLEFNNSREKHRLRGLLKKSEDEIKVLGVSPLGTTVFRVLESPVGSEPQIEVALEDLNSRISYLKRWYKNLRPLLFYRRQTENQNFPETFKSGQIRITEWDSFHVPKKIEMRTSKKSSSLISVEINKAEYR